jgi:hypothetical protein
MESPLEWLLRVVGRAYGRPPLLWSLLLVERLAVWTHRFWWMRVLVVFVLLVDVVYAYAMWLLS